MSSILLGTHTYAASGAAARRQDRGVASLRGLRHVHLANVQFTDAPHHVEGIVTLPRLRRDSTTVTRRHGPRKPLVSDIFNTLWHDARERGATYFAFTNADIQVTQDAIDWIVSGDRDAFILARADVEAATGQPQGMKIYGTDVFAIATAWWEQHRHRFRGYILGEPIWDNVYAAVLLCHGDAAIENRRPLVRHEAHAQHWTTAGPFANYLRLLAAYDATYFSLWCEYVTRLAELRSGGSSSDAEENDLRRRTFRWPPRLQTRLWQGLRNLKAFIRYRAAELRRASPLDA